MSIVSNGERCYLGSLSMAISEWLNWEKRQDQALSDEQLEEIGLGSKRVALCPGDYLVTRDADAAYVTFEETEYRLRLEQLAPKDSEFHPRWKVAVSSIKRVPGLYERLKQTKLFESIGSGTKTVYLYRFVYALYYGDDILYVEDAPSGKQLHIAHKNGVSCDDRWFNLDCLTKKAHLEFDTARDEAEEILRLERIQEELLQEEE